MANTVKSRYVDLKYCEVTVEITLRETPPLDAHAHMGVP